jgi:hypothetical protein
VKSNPVSGAYEARVYTHAVSSGVPGDHGRRGDSLWVDWSSIRLWGYISILPRFVLSTALSSIFGEGKQPVRFKAGWREFTMSSGAEARDKRVRKEVQRYKARPASAVMRGDDTGVNGEELPLRAFYKSTLPPLRISPDGRPPTVRESATKIGRASPQLNNAQATPVDGPTKVRRLGSNEEDQTGPGKCCGEAAFGPRQQDRIIIWKRSSHPEKSPGRKLDGELAPRKADLAQFIADHTDCEVYAGQDKNSSAVNGGALIAQEFVILLICLH